MLLEPLPPQGIRVINACIPIESQLSKKSGQSPVVEEIQLVEILRKVLASILLRGQNSLRSVNSHVSGSLTLALMIVIPSDSYFTFSILRTELKYRRVSIISVPSLLYKWLWMGL